MKKKKISSKLTLIMLVYLAGIFMGAIDTGIVTPAREIIQNSFGVGSKDGIWMITIYTLAYASSIPIMGKLADRIGRKPIYLVSISLFGIGSLLCGLTHLTGDFWFLVAARAIQAIGGGGIIPIATAEFGTLFPPEKRGMALGLVGATYGIANIFGSLAGSAILDIFGTQNWEFIFYVNIPITIFIVIGGIIALQNNLDEEPKKIDIPGIFVVTVMVLSLLYGLKNIDFFDFTATVTSVFVYPYLIAFVVFLPVLIFIERKAQDPVLNLKYFTNLRIVVTLIVSFVGGFVLMGIVFIPQFCENSLKVPAGRGGYFTVVLALLSGVSAMLSGRLLDKSGAIRVLQLGFSFSIVGALFLYFVAAPMPTVITVAVSLMLLGFGLGFTMGAPINYMILENIDDKEASSGMATVSLIRSIGTTIAPAIMVGFIAHAGISVQSNIMNTLPTEVKMPTLPYVKEISAEIDKLKKDPNMSEKLSSMKIADFSSMQAIKVNMRSRGNLTIPKELVDKFKTSDVTTITSITKEFAVVMFKQMSPKLIANIQGGIKNGMGGITSGLTGLEKGMVKLQSGINGIDQGITGMQAGLKQQKDTLAQLNAYLPKMTKPLPNNMSLLDIIPAQVKNSIPADVQISLAKVKTPTDLKAQIVGLEGAIKDLTTKFDKSKTDRANMVMALEGMKSTKNEMTTMLPQMQALYDAIPGAFNTAAANYLTEIDRRSGFIQSTYQLTLNTGYQSMFLVVTAASVGAMIALIFYRKRKATE